mgnify:CR=1 FL=1|jgi:hypothetical protein
MMIEVLKKLFFNSTIQQFQLLFINFKLDY